MLSRLFSVCASVVVVVALLNSSTVESVPPYQVASRTFDGLYGGGLAPAQFGGFAPQQQQPIAQWKQHTFPTDVGTQFPTGGEMPQGPVTDGTTTQQAPTETETPTPTPATPAPTAGAPTDFGATAPPTAQAVFAQQFPAPVAAQYQKYPRQVMPVQYAPPTYSTLPARFQAAQIPRIKPQQHTKTAPAIQQPTQYKKNQPIQAPALYGKKHH